MQVMDTAIPDVKVLEPDVFGDERGYFMEAWNKRKLAGTELAVDFVQDNESLSSQNVLRGLHYQIKQPQGKLVRVTDGEVFDVAVDLRRRSPTFGQWVGVHLNADNKRQLWVPPGFGHGFYVISAQASFVYKCTDYYAPEYERTLAWDDPDIGIEWPILDGYVPALSNKDAAGKRLREAEVYG